MRDEFPVFSDPVPPGGYRWWYVDASNADASRNLVVIAFIGSVFSPFFARANRRGPADPLDFCALNVALYRRRGKQWVMTEFDRADVAVGERSLKLGRSRLDWDGERLTIEIAERTAPLRRPVAGLVTVTPTVRQPREFAIDPRGRHRWWPVAPHARVDVDFATPAWRWSGAGYFDSNRGDEPLADGFVDWDWSRRHTDAGTEIRYNARPRQGPPTALALTIDQRGQAHEAAAAPPLRLPASGWRVARTTASAAQLERVRTLEDTPFYARSIVHVGDDPAPLMHESLSLQRFDSAWVQRLIPFRMRPFFRANP
ncbi:MAG: carotenoid 1,2-hydratase [Pseudomonadota bacterium]